MDLLLPNNRKRIVGYIAYTRLSVKVCVCDSEDGNELELPRQAQDRNHISNASLLTSMFLSSALHCCGAEHIDRVAFTARWIGGGARNDSLLFRIPMKKHAIICQDRLGTDKHKQKKRRKTSGSGGVSKNPQAPTAPTTTSL